jgi:phosphoribosylformylglycinamidine (FGAM) synthase-like enzyme
MWQFSEAVDGMTEACLALGTPVVGGNVSFYNESKGSDIDPTPVIGMLGLVERLDRPPPGVGLVDGGRLLLLGVTQPELSGSLWAWNRGHREGSLPSLDLAMHTLVGGVVRRLVAGGLVQGAHDVSTGGLGVALAEMAVRSGVGFQAARIHDHAALFAESPSRVVLCVDPDRVAAVLNVCDEAGVPVERIGAAGGDRLRIKDLLDVGLTDATDVWRNRLPDALGHGTLQD